MQIPTIPTDLTELFLGIVGARVWLCVCVCGVY
jgi:hypothetical protein